MSRATCESIALLALVSGCMAEIARRKLISRIDMRDLSAEIYSDTVRTINRWRETGDGQKNQDQIVAWFERWDRDYFKDKPKNKMRVSELVAMAERVAFDLSAKLSCRHHRGMVDDLHSKITLLMSFTDSEWSDHRAFEVAGESVDEIAEVMESALIKKRGPHISVKSLNRATQQVWAGRFLSGVME
ncbi:MAG: hypothetical protein JZU65_22575 [Chlorobium sp.]|nr:hypothetical protein [Chlorobium sp.]